MKATNHHEAKLLARAPLLCERAIGQRISVRDTVRFPRGNATVTGKIISAEPASFRYTQCSVILQFRVTIEAGANATRHTFIISRLPQSPSQSL